MGLFFAPYNLEIEECENMAESRDFRKKLEGGDKSPKKKKEYLMLGDYAKIHNRQRKQKGDCPGGDQNCKDCTDCGTNVIIVSPEALLQESEENRCDGSICDFCGEECGQFVRRSH